MGTEDGYDVDYTRVPVTDEKAPKDADFALLTKRLWNLPEGAALVFNCQMGRGRTTTGMIIASLLYLRRRHAGLQLPSHPTGEAFPKKKKKKKVIVCIILKVEQHLLTGNNSQKDLSVVPSHLHWP